MAATSSRPSGVKIVFRVGLVLLKCMLGSPEKLKKCQGLYETMELLRAIDARYMQESFLVREVQPCTHTQTHTHARERQKHTRVRLKHALIP